MANTPQSKKRARQNERRNAVNTARRSRIRTFLRKVEEAIETGDKAVASAALQAAQPELMRGVSNGVYHKNTAARKMSRLASRVKAIAKSILQLFNLRGVAYWPRLFNLYHYFSILEILFLKIQSQVRRSVAQALRVLVSLFRATRL